MLFDSQHQVIARNDDYYGTDSFIDVHLTPGTYYVGVSASGNANYDPNVSDSGVGGTTEGAYQLRLNFQPQDDSQMVDARGIALDGDADGTAGGQYNYWFNVNTANAVAAQNHTLIVDKLSAAITNNSPNNLGTIANPYNTISAALSAAKQGDVVRIVGNNFANDNQGDSIQAVAATNPTTHLATLTDGQTFTISDATKTFTFELDNNNSVAAGNIRVAFTAGDSAATIATKLAAAINSTSWIPDGLGQTTTTRTAGGLYARATVDAADNTVVDVNGPTVTIDVSASKLQSTLQDDKAYEIGTSPGVGSPALADGRTMDVPKGVTVMIDAGVMFKLRGANINVGSAAVTVDRSMASLQVLGTPGQSVYFTSYMDQGLGVDTYAPATVPGSGDWGGLVFANDYAAQAADPTQRILEQEGIFLNYVNHADIRYGGGKVTVNSVADVYDPVDMIQARPTVSFSTITHSADAAMSADPNSLLESDFHDRFGESLYTNDYGRVGPELRGNTLLNNSINGLFLRVTTNAGKSTEQLDVSARFDDVDTVLAIPQNLTIQGDAGEAVAVTGTCPLTATGRNELVVPDDTSVFVDGQNFTLSDGLKKVRFEFDVAGNGVTTGSVPVGGKTTDWSGSERHCRRHRQRDRHRPGKSEERHGDHVHGRGRHGGPQRHDRGDPGPQRPAGSRGRPAPHRRRRDRQAGRIADRGRLRRPGDRGRHRRLPDHLHLPGGRHPWRRRNLRHHQQPTDRGAAAGRLGRLLL